MSAYDGRRIKVSAAGASTIERESARARLVMAALGVALAAAARSPVVPLGLGALALGGLAVERVPVGRALRPLWASLFTVLLVLAVERRQAGAPAALRVGARVLGASAIGCWLHATTRPWELQAALVGLGAPAALVELIGLAGRQVAVLGAQLATAREAQAARLGWSSAGARLRSLSTLSGFLVARAADRSLVLAEAIEARGGGSRLAAVEPPRLAAPAIELEARSLGRRGRPVLTGVRLALAPGERVALVGGNGAGKTTLLRALAGLEPVDGELRVGGVRVRRIEEAVARGVGLALQSPEDQLFAPTVGEDVRSGPRNQGLPEAEVARRAGEALERLGIAGLAARPIDELSFGEQKRACLAGVLAMRPSVLLLDEPTAGLDPAGERELCAQLAAPTGATLLVATHAVDLVPRLASRVIVLGEGRVLADGPAREVFARGELLRAARLRPPVEEAWR